MNEYKYLQPLDQMERICRTVLGDQLDELLEKIDKENIGYVITDEGKDDLVLCPAQWFSFVFDDDFGCIVNSALRYSIGRHTYMPSDLMGFVRRYLDVMDTRTISVMIEDMQNSSVDGTQRLARVTLYMSLATLFGNPGTAMPTISSKA